MYDIQRQIRTLTYNIIYKKLNYNNYKNLKYLVVKIAYTNVVINHVKITRVNTCHKV